MPKASALLIALMTATAGAQTINIAIGPPDQQPPPRYAAAGSAGHWNAFPALNGSTTGNIRDIHGNLTGVTVSQFGGTELRSDDDPGTAGDDATLLDHCLITYTAIETCLFINGLQNGTYEVTVYGWMPNMPAVLSYTNSDEEPGNPHYLVGGPWGGAHEEFVTYARHISNVGPPGNDGLLRVHSGLAPDGEPTLGAACNGIQLRLLVPADLNDDGTVNAADLALLLGQWGVCHADCNADLNGDAVVDAGDLAILLGSWS